MICRSCGTEIADKALICYRCGAATFEAKVKPPPPRARRSLVPLVALVALVLLALYLGQVAADTVPRAVTWTLAVIAGLLAVWLVLRRRT